MYSKNNCPLFVFYIYYFLCLQGSNVFWNMLPANHSPHKTKIQQKQEVARVHFKAIVNLVVSHEYLRKGEAS